MPGEVSEKMWGEGYVTPGDVEVTDRLIRPLGINKDMSLLDLSAGLGGRLRKTTDDYGVYINGLEPDPEIAKRGMEMSKAAGRGKRVTITAYDPLKLTVDRLYDCIIARETIYRVTEKEKFIKSIVASCKPKAQVSFTDYIVDPEVRDKPAIIAWRAFEKGSDPLGLVQMAEMWAKAGFNLRVHDDMSDFYKKEVMVGLARFAKFMASGGPKPDAETKKSIDKRITTWAHRMAAMEQGMKFYRFYGLR
jgi:cyclopropane fatty-acyl-phospholipid synthase-like methyltransferase